MVDPVIKRALTIIALALSILTFQSISSALLQTHAQTKPHRQCVWTYIVDAGRPNIGEDGNVDFSRGSNWKRLSEEGWELKGVDHDRYLFERCEP